jgi:hypothetical protein
MTVRASDWGTRVRFKDSWQLYPHVNVEARETGVVIEPYAPDWYKNGNDDPSYVFVRLDKHDDALSEWDNEVHGVPPEYLEEIPPLAGAERSAAVERIAREFSRVLGSWLSRSHRFQAIRDNAAEEDRQICHSHDHCDANMAMLEGFESVLGYDMNPASEDTAGLANDAWAMAKVNRFWWGSLGGIKK